MKPYRFHHLSAKQRNLPFLCNLTTHNKKVEVVIGNTIHEKNFHLRLFDVLRPSRQELPGRMRSHRVLVTTLETLFILCNHSSEIYLAISSHSQDLSCNEIYFFRKRENRRNGLTGTSISPVNRQAIN